MREKRNGETARLRGLQSLVYIQFQLFPSVKALHTDFFASTMTSTVPTPRSNEEEVSNDFGLSLFFGGNASTELPHSGSPSTENPANEFPAAEATTTTTPTAGSQPNITYSVDDGNSSTYKCSPEAVVTTADGYREDESGVDVTSLILEEVVEFDYDILLTNKTDVTAAISNLERKLLYYVGSELIGTGCSLRNRKQRAMKGTLIRRTLVDTAGAIDVTEISSEPQDEVSNGDDGEQDLFRLSCSFSPLRALILTLVLDAINSTTLLLVSLMRRGERIFPDRWNSVLSRHWLHDCLL